MSKLKIQATDRHKMIIWHLNIALKNVLGFEPYFDEEE